MTRLLPYPRVRLEHGRGVGHRILLEAGYLPLEDVVRRSGRRRRQGPKPLSRPFHFDAGQDRTATSQHSCLAFQAVFRLKDSMRTDLSSPYAWVEREQSKDTSAHIQCSLDRLLPKPWKLTDLFEVVECRHHYKYFRSRRTMPIDFTILSSGQLNFHFGLLKHLECQVRGLRM